MSYKYTHNVVELLLKKQGNDKFRLTVTSGVEEETVKDLQNVLVLKLGTGL